jgi:ribosomal protein L29
MRKEELDRRCAEMKARVLGQRTVNVHEQHPKVSKLRSAPKDPRDDKRSTLQTSDDSVDALKKQVARLEAENTSLRRQIATLTSSVATPSQSGEDSVREQRHNFLKYSVTGHSFPPPSKQLLSD